MTAEGEVQLTYAYPAGSLMQYLGITLSIQNKDDAFFHKLLSSKGIFNLYPEDDKYRMKMQFPEEPYRGYTIYGYLEIVKEVYRGDVKSFHFYFDKLSIEKGDSNNIISVNFSNTTHQYEMEYFSAFVNHILKNKFSSDKVKRAYAIWLENYFTKMNCPALVPIWDKVQKMIRSNTSSLPNTEPLPVS